MKNLSAVSEIIDLNGDHEGPLSQFSFAAKDNIDIGGHITGCGNPTWKATHSEASISAPIIKRLLSEGANLKAKTIMDEMAYSLDGVNVHYGTPYNTNAPKHIPGGSSCGSASIVASGDVDFALGTDTAGSVRVPASYCGIFGIRLSHGLVPANGIVPLAESLDVPGIFSRDLSLLKSAANCLLDDQIGFGEKPEVLILIDAFELAHPSARQIMIEYIESHILSNFSVRYIKLGDKYWNDLNPIFQNIQRFEAWKNHGAWIEGNNPDFAPNVKDRFTLASQVSMESYLKSNHDREHLIQEFDNRFGKGAVFCLPTVPDSAPLLDTDLAALEQFRAKALKLLVLASLLKRPQISIPIISPKYPPVGLSLIGGYGTDLAIIDLAEKLLAN